MSENEKEIIVGIDLGTTNSEVAAMVGDRPQVLGPGTTRILPSCVGISPDGELLVGEPARNQYLVYPDRTVRSIKRRMGDSEKVCLGDQEFLPQDISSLILRELAEWASRALDKPVKKAVITVPAYFSDAQRNATREAGALAGLEVVRILNEPTAASLAYGFNDGSRRTVMVYDLGGGTFDVSIVSIEGDITEVLASHGNNRLGGDDFDKLLLDRLLDSFRKKHGVDLHDCHPASYSRMRWAAEEAKKKLSFEPYAKIREENLVKAKGKDLHFEEEISRQEYEDMIRPLVESTLESVSRALEDAGKTPDQIDAVLLVGGSTRTPLIWKVLRERIGVEPRQDIHPDLCVALGAGVLASRMAGYGVERVLVDVSPFSFGPSYLGEKDGFEYPFCYHPIIHRNTPLPITRTDSYMTSYPYQTAVEIQIFQGEDPDALKNIPVGRFRVEGLTSTPNPNEVLCRMSLDIDGILKVTAIEKRTGKSKSITIDNALNPRSETEINEARKLLQELYTSRDMELEEMFENNSMSDLPEGVLAGEADVIGEEDISEDGEDSAAGTDDEDSEENQAIEFDVALTGIVQEARSLIERSRKLMPRIHAEDKEEIIDLHEQIEQAMKNGDNQGVETATAELKELLFFIEGK